jgi:K+-sensing histidine kinase KdpD
VNESAGEQLSELINDVLQLPTTDTLDGADESDEPAQGRTTREGLPRSFRMRHDAHYVDELLSAPTAASVTPTRVSATAALALIAGRLESLVAHAAVIDAHQDGATLVARTVQAEFARVARLSRAAVIANDGETLYRGTVSVGEIADDVTRAIAPIARSGCMDCEISVDDRTFTLTADPALVVHAIVATIDALSELMRSHPRRRAVETRQLPARISFTVQSAKVRPALIVDLTCPSVSIAERQAERLFENHEEDYRESAGAGVLLAAAARVARAHGGRADVKRHAVAGVTITFVYPQAPPDPRLA